MPQLVQREENICADNDVHWLLITLLHTAATIILLYHSYSNLFHSVLFKTFCCCIRVMCGTPVDSERWEAIQGCW